MQSMQKVLRHYWHCMGGVKVEWRCEGEMVGLESIGVEILGSIIIISKILSSCIIINLRNLSNFVINKSCINYIKKLIVRLITLGASATPIPTRVLTLFLSAPRLGVFSPPSCSCNYQTKGTRSQHACQRICSSKSSHASACRRRASRAPISVTVAKRCPCGARSCRIESFLSPGYPRQESAQEIRFPAT